MSASRRAAALILAGGLLAGCVEPELPQLAVSSLPALPEPVANNAVAVAGPADDPVLVSLMGLGAGRTWRDVHARGWALPAGADEWRPLAAVPGPGGRLAGTAVGFEDGVLLFGGYTVAEDGTEVSVERVQRLDFATGAWTDLAPMPVPVDDAVSFRYGERYVYLVSG